MTCLNSGATDTEGKGYSVWKADYSVPVSKCKENEFCRSFFLGNARICQTFLLINWTDNNYIVLPITSLKTKNLKMWSWLAQIQILPAWGYSAYVCMYSTNLIL